MTSPSRLQVALPAIVTFIFGLAFGLVAGKILWVAAPGPGSGGAQPDLRTGSAGNMGAPPPQQQAQGPDDAQMRQMLAAHEGLLEKDPANLSLVRTVGNYHAILGQNEQALTLYARAMELAEKEGNASEVTDIMIDQGVALVEQGDVAGGLKRLEEASARDDKDVRSRLTRAAVYLERVMPAPPPGFDRKQALTSAESVLDEVEAIEPDNEFAVQFRSAINGVRTMMGRPREGAAPPAPTPLPAASVDASGTPPQ